MLDMGAYYQPIQGANSSADRPDTLDLAGYPAPGNMQDADDGEQQQQQQSGGCCRGWIGCLQQLRSNSSAASALTSASSSRRGFSASPSLAGTASGASSRQPWGSRISQLSALFRRQASSAGGSGAQPPQPVSQQQQQRHGTMSHTTASSTSSAVPAAAAASAAGGGEASSPHSVFERVRSFRRMLSNTYGAEGNAAGSSSGRRQRDWSSLRLFQVLPAALTGRAHVWHNQLNLKDGWRPYDMPYFDAVSA